MRRSIPWAAPAIALAMTLGCSQETPSKKTSSSTAPKAETAAADVAANQVTLHVEGMV